jgi:hypothetical protein
MTLITRQGELDHFASPFVMQVTARTKLDV